MKGIIHITNEPRPNLERGLFWDWDWDRINWQKSYRSIIERVLERGTMTEWEEIIRFYGKEAIIRTLKDEIKFLPDFIISNVSDYFKINKEDMACYRRKLLRKGQWI